MSYLKGAALLAVVAALPVNAAVLTFEEFNHGDDLVAMSDIAVPNTSITYNVSVSGNNAGSALIFDTAENGTPDPDLEAPFAERDENGDLTGNFLDPGNILIIGNNNPNGDPVNDDPNGGTILLEFSQSVSFLSVNLFDTGDFNSEVDIELFDSVGNVLGSFLNVGQFIGDNEYTTVTLSGFGSIASFTLTGSGAIDNLVVAVPEPTSLALLGLGVLAGAGLRRRSRR
ncbi:MAG: PEP-CTERM sorting domain-containing protein [Pseudomonadota bacterium]